MTQKLGNWNSNIAAPTNLVGLRIREREPMIPELGEPHTAYYDNVWEAMAAAQGYPLAEYELAIVFEERTADGWKVVDTLEVE